MIKKHVTPGVVLYSDCHSSYWTSGSNTSKLTKYGWYHYWICHMVSFVHEKFGFVHTSAIEITWANLKKTVLGLSNAVESEAIERYLNSFTFRQIFRKECLHAMIMRAMRLYYNNKYTKYLKLAEFEEVTLPNIFEIEECLKDLQDFSKRPKFMKSLRNYTKMGRFTIPNSLTALGKAKHPILDHDDIKVPERTSDFPKSMLRLLALEKAR